jgi:hypothetical protein
VSLFVVSPEIEDRDEVEVVTGRSISFSIASDMLQLFVKYNKHYQNVNGKI